MVLHRAPMLWVPSLRKQQISFIHIHGQGTLQAREDPKDHLRFICCLLVTRGPKAKSLLSLKLRSITQPYNSALSGGSASGNLQSSDGKYTLQTYKVETAKGLLHCSGIVLAGFLIPFKPVGTKGVCFNHRPFCLYFFILSSLSLKEFKKHQCFKLAYSLLRKVTEDS